MTSLESNKDSLELVSKCGWNLKFLPYNLRDDPQVVLAAVQSYGWALQYASPRLKSKRYIVLEAIKNDYLALPYADPVFYGDKEIMILALQKHGYYLKLAIHSLKKDPEIVISALIQNSNVLQFADPIFQEKEDLLLYNLGEPLDLVDKTNSHYHIYNWINHHNLLELIQTQYPALINIDLEINGILLTQNTLTKCKAELLCMESGPQAIIIYP